MFTLFLLIILIKRVEVWYNKKQLNYMQVLEIVYGNDHKENIY